MRTQLQQIPVTALVALAYVTLAFLTDPVSPERGPLLAHGALRPVDVADGEPWRLLSHAFLHGGLLHLMLNLVALLQLGPLLELSLGSPRFLALYVCSALSGGAAVCLMRSPLETVVGGSGALFGMLGAVLALGIRSGRHALQFFEEGPGKAVLGLIAVNLVAGMLFPMISNTAHVGGLVSGFAVTFWFLTPSRVRPGRSDLALRIALVLAFASALIYVARPVASPEWLLLQWQQSSDPARKQALARAYARARLGPGTSLLPSERELRYHWRDLETARRGD